MAKSTRGVRPGRRHPTILGVPRPVLALGRRPPAPELSRAAQVRLAMLDWHRSHGENVARTARHFGDSRPTVYRWLARFERSRLESLDDRSSRPVRRRRPTWTLAQLVAVRRERERYPRWGARPPSVPTQRVTIAPGAERLDDLDDTLGGSVAGSAGSVLGPRILQIRRARPRLTIEMLRL